VGTLIARVTLVSTAQLVEQFTTLEEMAPGRVIAALGTGDKLSKPEHDAYGLALPESRRSPELSFATPSPRSRRSCPCGAGPGLARDQRGGARVRSRSQSVGRVGRPRPGRRSRTDRSPGVAHCKETWLQTLTAPRRRVRRGSSRARPRRSMHSKSGVERTNVSDGVSSRHRPAALCLRTDQRAEGGRPRPGPRRHRLRFRESRPAQPDVAVEKLAEAAHNPKNHRYSASRGIPNLRQAIANRYKLRSSTSTWTPTPTWSPPSAPRRASPT
jgi:hypothetical protein